MQKTLEVRRYEQDATLRDRFGCAWKFEVYFANPLRQVGECAIDIAVELLGHGLEIHAKVHFATIFADVRFNAVRRGNDIHTGMLGPAV